MLAAIGLFGCGGAGPIRKIDGVAATEVPSIEAVGGTVGSFRADDGVALRYASFPARGTPRGNAIVVTGRTQFIEVYLEQIGNLRDRGFAVWAMDWRGQGLSGGHPEDDRHKGHIHSFTRYLRDLRQFRHEVAQAGPGGWLLLSQSMGGGLSVRYAIEHPGDFDAVVVGAPLLDLAAGRTLVRFVSWRGKSAPLDYVAGEGGGYGQHLREFDGNPFTRDRRRFLRQHAYIDREPKLALGAPTQGWIRAAWIHVQHFDAPAFAARLKTPTLILSAEEDKLVSIAAQERIAAQSSLVRRVILPGTLHEVWLSDDVNQRRIWAEVGPFLDRHLPQPNERREPLGCCPHGRSAQR
ncbi:MAG: alpha/beta hydrolase [Deltaproteobacteria bacterium]|nr:alpha/beta hydrolase [Deltaproteobacteria bacterium]